MQLHWKSWSGNDKSDDKGKDVETQNATTSEQPNQKNNMEDEVVPVVIRPGHIRFEPREGGKINYSFFPGFGCIFCIPVIACACNHVCLFSSECIFI